MSSEMCTVTGRPPCPGRPPAPCPHRHQPAVRLMHRDQDSCEPPGLGLRPGALAILSSPGALASGTFQMVGVMWEGCFVLQEPPSPASSFQCLERATRALKGTGMYTPLKESL